MNKDLLYHGSYIEVSKPLLKMCEDGKDFGKGFYVTTSKEQAEKFCRSAVGKAFKNGKISSKQAYGYVSVYEYAHDDKLKCFSFKDADGNWLKCIGAHRREILFNDELNKWNKYDILSGKIANDNTNAVITNYINGDYGNPSSEVAIDFAIKLLKPERLTDQLCFRSNSSLKCLKFVRSYKVKINE